MPQPSKGYTIVELVVIIIVLGVLFTVGTMFYSWAGTIGRDQARELEAKTWINTFNTYKAHYFVYPVMPTDSSTPAIGCLGEFSDTSNRCGDFNNSGASYSDTTADTLLAEVDKIGDVPQKNSPVVNGTLAGPMYYVSRASDTPPYTVTASILNYSEGDCPKDATDVTTTGPYNYFIPSPDGYHLCMVQTNFSYDPN